MILRTAARRAAGISYVEVLVGAGIFLAIGAVLYPFFRSTLVLTAQNVAINTTHMESRAALARVTGAIREAASTPRLVNAGLAPVTTGSAAGIEFHELVSGPVVVWNSINTSSKNIRLTKRRGDRTLIGEPPGLLLSIPSLDLLQEIEDVKGEGGGQRLHNVQLKVNPQISSNVKIISGEPIYPAFVVKRVAYVVAGGVLRYYPRSDLGGAFIEIARDVTSPTPFSIASDGTATITADFTFTDKRSNNRDPRMAKIRSTFVTSPRTTNLARFR